MDVTSIEIQVSQIEGTDVAIVEGAEVIIRDVQDALDLLATISYTHGCTKAVLNKEQFAEV